VAEPSSTITTSVGRLTLSTTCITPENGSPMTSRLAPERLPASDRTVRAVEAPPSRGSCQCIENPRPRASSVILRSWSRDLSCRGASTTIDSSSPVVWVAYAHSSTLSSWAGLSTKATVDPAARVGETPAPAYGSMLMLTLG